MKQLFKIFILIFMLDGVGISTRALVDFDTETSGGSSVLEFKSTEKEFLAPSMLSAERDAAIIPTQGLMVYRTDTKSMETCRSGSDTWNEDFETEIDTGNNITNSGSATAPAPYVINQGAHKFYLGQDTLGGIVFYLYMGEDGQQHALIVSKDETVGQWSDDITTRWGADRTEDGAYNTYLMPNSSIVKTWVTDHGEGWYLPSIDEFSLLWHNRYLVQKSLRAAGGTLLPTAGNYWTSTEYTDTKRVFYFLAGNGYANVTVKTDFCSARAIKDTRPAGNDGTGEYLEYAQILNNANWDVTRLSESILWKYHHFKNFFSEKQSINIFDVDLSKGDVSVEIPYVTPGYFLKTSEGAMNVDATAAVNGRYFDTKNGGSSAFFVYHESTITPSTFVAPWRTNAGLSIDREDTKLRISTKQKLSKKGQIVHSLL